MSKKISNAKIHVLSLGGSLIIPDGVDDVFIKNFRNLILKRIETGNKFIIVCGGGKLNKRYNEAARKIRKPAGKGCHRTESIHDLVGE